jgi:hypothetical protein
VEALLLQALAGDGIHPFAVIPAGRQWVSIRMYFQILTDLRKAGYILAHQPEKFCFSLPVTMI